jgi:hypothetical protein
MTGGIELVGIRMSLMTLEFGEECIGFEKGECFLWFIGMVELILMCKNFGFKIIFENEFFIKHIFYN